VVQAVLREHGAHIVVISRSGEDDYESISRHADAAIIVNTTPVGMYPNTSISPVDLDLFPHLEGVMDVVYNPARTKLLLDAEKRRIITMNGLWMLIAQAKCTAEWFTGAPIAGDKTAHIHAVLKNQAENIVLIGMPGCGKSTVGQILAEKTGRRFVDTDKLIEEMVQKSIPRIFTEDGEDAFRDLETKVLNNIGKESGLVIATGGGCVTQQHNYPLLHQNGIVYWLQRDVEKLATCGRPLSKDLREMYHVRRKLYEDFADHVIDNNAALIDAVNRIADCHVGR
jgi:shikimate dehydrogenase